MTVVLLVDLLAVSALAYSWRSLVEELRGDEAACQGEAHGQGEDHNCYFYLWYVGNAFQ